MLPIKNTQLVRTTFALRAKAELPADIQWVCSPFLSLKLNPEHLSYSVFLCFFSLFTHPPTHPPACPPHIYLTFLLLLLRPSQSSSAVQHLRSGIIPSHAGYNLSDSPSETATLTVLLNDSSPSPRQMSSAGAVNQAAAELTSTYFSA